MKPAETFRDAQSSHASTTSISEQSDFSLCQSDSTTIDSDLVNKFEDLDLKELSIEVEDYTFKPDVEFLNFILDCVKDLGTELTSSEDVAKYIFQKYLHCRKLNFDNPVFINKCKIFEEKIRGYCDRDVSDLRTENNCIKKNNRKLLKDIEDMKICYNNSVKINDKLRKTYSQKLNKSKHIYRERRKHLNNTIKKLKEKFNLLSMELEDSQNNLLLTQTALDGAVINLQSTEEQLKLAANENKNLQLQLQAKMDSNFELSQKVANVSEDLKKSINTEENLRRKIWADEDCIKELKISLTSLIRNNLLVTDTIQERMTTFNNNFGKFYHNVVQKYPVVVTEDTSLKLHEQVSQKLKNKIKNIHSEVGMYEKQIDQFQGSKKNMLYVRITEALTRNILKLEDIDCNGIKEIQSKRTEEIAYIKRIRNKLNNKLCVT